MPDMLKVTNGLAGGTSQLTKTVGLDERGSSDKEKKLEKACTDFEAILVYYMFKTMRQSVPKTNFLKQSAGKDAYEMMLDQKIAEDMAIKGKGTGIQKALYQQLKDRL